MILGGTDTERSRLTGERLAHQLELPFFTWNRTGGCGGWRKTSDFGTEDLRSALQHIRSSSVGALHWFRLAPNDLDDRVLAETVEELLTLSKPGGGLLLTGLRDTVPENLKGKLASIEIPVPTPGSTSLPLSSCETFSARKVRVELSREQATRLVANLRGFTMGEAEKVLTAQSSWTTPSRSGISSASSMPRPSESAKRCFGVLPCG